MIYSVEAINYAREDALEWLATHNDGYPRSWEEEAKQDKRRGYIRYDDFQAPPIAGYEALEKEGVVERLGTVHRNGAVEERVHFRLKALANEDGKNESHRTIGTRC